MKKPKQEAVTCPAGVQPGNPDLGKGQFSQGVSYGIPMMQVGHMAADGECEQIQETTGMKQPQQQG
jgi:hypothetical protein